MNAECLLTSELSQWLAARGYQVRLEITEADGRALSPAAARHVKEQLASVQELSAAREKLAALGQVSATTAHELRNILTGIVGLAQLSDTLDPAERDELLRAEARRCLRVLDTYLEFSAPHATRPALLSVEAIVEPVALMLAGEARSLGVDLEVKGTAGSASFYGYQGPIRQVVLNLALNALQASSRGQCVELGAAVTGDGERLVLEVLDRGPGIAAELSDKIFDAFVTTRSGKGGTGLGLHACRDLVDAMGGRIEWQPRDGGGTRFSVTLPIGADLPSALGRLSRGEES